MLSLGGGEVNMCLLLRSSKPGRGGRGREREKVGMGRGRWGREQVRVHERREK